jgi:hypothetical protein
MQFLSKRQNQIIEMMGLPEGKLKGRRDGPGPRHDHLQNAQVQGLPSVKPQVKDVPFRFLSTHCKSGFID